MYGIRWILPLLFFWTSAFADDDFGYIFYAHTANSIGKVAFKEDDAILVKTKLKSIKLKGKEGFTAIVDFKRMDLGQPQGKWEHGRMDFSKWHRPKPLSQQDPNAWTTEPAHSQPAASLPREVCASGDEGCKAVAGLIYEFHNSDLCDQINRTAAIADSRTIQLLKAWNVFIKQKSQGKCRVGPPGNADKAANCERLKRARDVDILTRTTVFESEQLNTKMPQKKAVARHDCEQDIIMLAIRNTAFDKRCRKIRKRKMLHGCNFPGDFTGVATKPEEINIWLPDAALDTRITGCFLRADAEDIVWKKSEMMKNPESSKAAFMGRRKDYMEVLERAYHLTNPAEKMEDWFDIEMEGQPLTTQEKQKLINTTKLYYHPIGMAKCDPKVYDQTLYVGMGNVTKGKENYLLGGTRFLPTKQPQKKSKTPITIDSIYTLELRGDRYGSSASWEQYHKMLAGGVVANRFVDRDRANVCWPTEKSSCKLDEKLDYRKAPLWAISPNNEKYRFSCRSQTKASYKTWVWNGSCDTGMVVVPEPHFK